MANPEVADVDLGLRKLRTEGPSSHACLQRDDGVYLQAAGSPGDIVLEKRLGPNGRQFRGFQDVPVVPFEGPTEMRFGGGKLTLEPNDWFKLVQVIEVFAAFLDGRDEPAYVRWQRLAFLGEE